jgi:hypothetical protein
MEDSRIEWHRSRYADAALVFLWSYVIVSFIIFASMTSDIGGILFILGVLLFGIIVAMVTLYDRFPYLVGIAEDRIVFRHRYRFRKPRHKEVPWQEISRLELKREKGAPRKLYTDEGVRHLRVSDEVADQIEHLWRKRKVT